jgi:hypothetical protein
MKVTIIKTLDGYMVEKPNGDYLFDMHGNNLWDTYSEAESVVAWVCVDLADYINDYKGLQTTKGAKA